MVVSTSVEERGPGHVSSVFSGQCIPTSGGRAMGKRPGGLAGRLCVLCASVVPVRRWRGFTTETQEPRSGRHLTVMMGETSRASSAYTREMP